jgi:DNA polymerase III delta prime subunit
MGRPERPLDNTNDPIAKFARDLRELRKQAGNPSYRELARKALFVPSVLSSAASGYRLPTLPVTLAFVTSCGGEPTVWERRWRTIARDTGAAAKPCNGRPAAISVVPTGNAASPDQPRLIPLGMPASIRPAQLPLGSSIFVGRRQALDNASAIMAPARSGKVPLMISGPIGVGKTAFALRLAGDFAAEFPDGHLYADLGLGEAGRPSPDSIMRGFLRALGVPAPLIPEDQAHRVGMYRSWLAQRRLFVLLENACDEGQIRPLLGPTPYSQFVVTSRARLFGLDGMHRIDLDVLARQESLALLGRLVGAGRVEAEYEAANAVAELCGDLPLAINIIGRKTASRPDWTISYTASLLADHHRLMASLCIGDVSIRSLFASAYRLLPGACQRVIQQLGRDGQRWATAIDLATAFAISVSSADELLDRLADAGLLTGANAARRYGVSTLVRAFAADMHRAGAPSSASIAIDAFDCSGPAILPVNTGPGFNDS